MSVEYKSIRVTPATYDRALRLREAIRLRSVEGIPMVAKDSAKITFGRVIEAALELLEREVGVATKETES